MTKNENNMYTNIHVYCVNNVYYVGLCFVEFLRRRRSCSEITKQSVARPIVLNNNTGKRLKICLRFLSLSL